MMCAMETTGRQLLDETGVLCLRGVLGPADIALVRAEVDDDDLGPVVPTLHRLE